MLLQLLLPGALIAADNRQQLEQIRSRMEGIQTELSGKQKRRQAMQQELMSAEKDIGRQSQELKRLDRMLTEQRQRIRAAKIQQGLNKNALITQRKIMEKQIRAAYAVGRQDRLKLLLNQQDPAVAGRLMVYHDYFIRGRVKQLDLLQDTLKKLHQAEAEMTAEEHRMNELQTRKQQERSNLEQSRNDRKRLIVGLNQDISSGTEQLRELKRDEIRLRNLLTQIQKKAAEDTVVQPRNTPFAQQQGKLNWPAKGRFVARFGTEKRGGLKWDGVLIGAPEGAEVKAVYAGKVVFADWLRGFGLLLILDHGDGYMTLYGHNQSLAKQPGDLVRSNEVVAVLGDSGGLPEPGVYFAMRHNGQPINPNTWFK
jgi:septal ring factor EnvC (AmiA/AmiB activator)